MKSRFAQPILAMIAIVFVILITRTGLQSTGRSVNELPVRFASAFGLGKGSPAVTPWPPLKGERFPDLVLPDQNGDPVRLSDYAGRVMLVEYVAISCMGCQAFSGGADRGAFGRFGVQPGLKSIDQYARQYAGVSLGKDVVFVQILLYGSDMNSPAASEAKRWAAHFRLDRNLDEIVLRASDSMLSRETHRLIPGFQLVDRDFTVVSDSCGHHPADDLYRELLPMMGKLVRR